MYELLAAGNDLEAAESVARSLGGVCYLGDPNEQRELPFRALVRCVTDTPQSLAPAANVGLYLGFCRVIRERPITNQSGSASRGNRNFSAAASSQPHSRSVRCSLARRTRATCFTSSPRHVGLHPTQRRQDVERTRSRWLRSRKFRIGCFHEGTLFRRRQRSRSHISRRCKVR